MIKIVSFWLMLSSFTFFVQCTQKKNRIDERPEFAQYYQSLNVKGSFLLYDSKKQKYIIYDKESNKIPTLPASTFKIFNSLAALEFGAIPDEQTILKWNKIQHDFPNWNRDHNLASAMTHSVVWFYQEMARRIGMEKMKSALLKTKYGNGDLGAGIDLFWLKGKFAVTPWQQIELLQNLYYQKLPFQQKSMAITKKIMLVEEGNGYKIYAKTGMLINPVPKIGWWIGFIETKDNVIFFVNRVMKDDWNDNFPKARIDIAKQILRSLHYLP